VKLIAWGTEVLGNRIDFDESTQYWFDRLLHPMELINGNNEPLLISRDRYDKCILANQEKLFKFQVIRLYFRN
jgi:hypothetical protein